MDKLKTHGKSGAAVLLFKICALALFIQLCPPASHLTFAQDKIIAIVNDDIITQQTLAEFMNFMRMQLSRQYQGRDLENRLAAMKMNLLDKLIEDRLILQEAKKTKIRIDEARVKARIDEIKKHYRSDIDFQKDINKQGMVQADLENRIREQMFMYNIVEYKIKDKIRITPEEVTDYYSKNSKDFIAPEERELEVMVLDNADLASSFSYSLKSGQKLSDLAARYAIALDQMKAKRGAELRPEVENAVFSLGIGEISQPVKVDQKYYIFRLVNIISSKQLALSEVQANIRDFLFERKMQADLAKWIEELKKQSYIKVMQN